ncbi:MAG: tRNA uridine-5-carboxymethylaminomethyl(34) synthesis GTPase MnmE [Clostridiales bacterium]|nr:tRNA uridine-5-carboxymethylaminomethyl(34) synthesis GTPase MnmE [Clostridiales bacterium]
MLEDTIAAIATAPGIGGIGIIRVSGKEAFSVVSHVFKPKDAFFNILNPTPNTIKYGTIIENDKVIDEVLVSFFKAPNSYTTENTVEINCHGGIVVVRKILDLLLKNGARIAEAGEFTKRAFLNGRIDLAQAESVIDIISSKTDKARNLAISQLRGDLSEKLREIKEIYYDILIQIEAGIDYPEHDIEEISRKEIKEKLEMGKEKLEKLLNSFEEGRVIKEGVRTVILGKPNVGKSSLMNVLLKEERAIVTEIAGTTRDTIEEVVNVRGIPLVVVDTAGIRETEDIVEEIGVNKAIKEIDVADMIIAVFDLSRELTDEDNKIINLIKDKKSIIIINKEDLDKKWNPEEIFKNKELIFVSLKNKNGIEDIENAIEKMWSNNNLDSGEEAVITNIRHKNLIFEAIEEANSSIDALKSDLPVDMVSINIKSLADKIGEILGDNVSEDIIHGIFSRFCLGK